MKWITSAKQGRSRQMVMPAVAHHQEKFHAASSLPSPNSWVFVPDSLLHLSGAVIPFRMERKPAKMPSLKEDGTKDGGRDLSTKNGCVQAFFPAY
jgi:hypothetical protein